MRKETATDVSKLMLQIGAQLDDSVAFVQQHEPTNEFESYRRNIAHLMTEMWVRIMAPIYSDYPDLKPPEIK